MFQRNVTVYQCIYLSVCSGCCSKISQTSWFISKRNVFLTVPEVWSMKSRWQDGWVRALFCVATSHCVLTCRKHRGALCGVWNLHYLVGSGLCCVVQELLLWCMGFGACGLSSCIVRAWCLFGMWDVPHSLQSSPARDQIHDIARQIRKHWTSREVPVRSLL